MKKLFLLLFAANYSLLPVTCSLLTVNCSLLTVQAQDYQKIDSLKKVLKTLPALNGTDVDTLRMNTCIDIGNLFLNPRPDSAKFWFSIVADTVFSVNKIEENPRLAYYNSTALRYLGIANAIGGIFPKAIAYFEKSLKISEVLLDKSSIAKCLNNLGNIFFYKGEYNTAISYYEKSLKICEDIWGKSVAVLCFNSLGNIYNHNGDYEKAFEFYQKALNTNEEIGNRNGVAECYNSLGNLFSNKEIYSKSIENYERSLKVFEELQNKSGIAMLQSNLGILFLSQGNYTKAFGYYKNSLKTNEEIGDKRGIATCFANIGNMFGDYGDYPKAIEYHEKSLKIFEELGDKRNISSCLNNLAIVYSNQGDYVKSLDSFEKALKTFEKLGNKKAISKCLNNMGTVYDNQGNLAKAKEYFKNSLKIKEELGDKYGISACIINLGYGLYKQGNYIQAIALFEKSLTIFEGLNDKREMTKCFLSLGNIYSEQCNYQTAIVYYEKLFKIEEEIGMLADLADHYPDLAFVYVKQKKYAQAIPLYLKAIRIKRKLIQDNFSILSEKEKELFLEKSRLVFNTLNELATITKTDSIYSQCYNNVLLLKGLLLQSNRGIADAVSKSSDTSLVSTYWHLKKLRTDIAELYSIPINEREINLDSLENQANEEERKLVLLSKDYSGMQKQFNYKWENVQTALKKDEAAIEFVKINCELLLKDFFVKIDTIKNTKGLRDSIAYSKERKDSTFYAAFIIRPGYTTPIMIPLFDEKELELILNKMVNNRGVKILEQPATKEKSRELYDLIWLPIESELKGVKTVYYSPDGLLYKVSFAAMTSPDNKFLFDKYNLKTLNSTREIFSQNKPLQINSDFTCSIYGGIQYDLDENKLITNAKKYKPDEKFDLVFNEKEKSIEMKRGGEWNYLKGTLLEAETIKKEFENQKVATNFFSGENANEESFKSLSSKSPTIIHIATHGFYIADNKNKNSDLEAGNNFKNNKNPLFRSGLIMSGANRVWLGNDAIDGVDDGILTAFEVSNLDLSNTKLVVLSACETGLGEIRGSEGVYGLQRAFKMAGVQYIIMTLWEIRDEVTVEFMGTFYKQWLKGKDIYAAFKCAQDEMRKKYEANYWAAFVLVE